MNDDLVIHCEYDDDDTHIIMLSDHIFQLRNLVPIVWNKRLTKSAGYCVSGVDRATNTNKARIELSTKVCDSAGNLSCIVY